MTIAAKPKYKVGQRVRYVDRNNRPQIGKIHSIEANWHDWWNGANHPPFVVYTLWHPTYRNNHCYRTEDDIIGRADRHHVDIAKPEPSNV